MPCRLHNTAGCTFCARAALVAQTERATPVFGGRGFAPIGNLTDFKSGKLKRGTAPRRTVIGGAK